MEKLVFDDQSCIDEKKKFEKKAVIKEIKERLNREIVCCVECGDELEIVDINVDYNEVTWGKTDEHECYAQTDTKGRYLR